MYVIKTVLIQFWFYLGYYFFLLNGKTFHQPPVLLWSKFFCFLCTAWPLEFSICKTFVAQKPAVTFIQKCFHAVVSTATEKENRACICRIQSERGRYNRNQSFDPLSEIGVSSAQIYMFETGRIIEHGGSLPELW